MNTTSAIKLYIKSADSSPFELEAKLSDTVESLKKVLRDHFSISKFSLYYQGSRLSEKSTLACYSIANNSILEFVKEGDRIIDIITLGLTQVGKTSLLERFEMEEFKLIKNTTLGVDFIMPRMKVDNEELRLKLWDTAGQEKYYSVTKSMYQKCRGALIVFDVGNPKSLTQAEIWIQFIKKETDASIVIYLIANKIDIPERKVEVEEGEELAKKYNLPYYETSAKTGDNVNDVLVKMTKEICSKRYGIAATNAIKITSRSCTDYS
eukprot:TRINITY_DN289_c0_g5_i1.p1 TRINITY_DN289_c0_g5~~TRINITY_DN289_c0_g5_i1.p1  ORF type:complete len:265 (+),score=24.07 TRINITY_DN289_c0_g5_i1:114-908(+)